MILEAEGVLKIFNIKKYYAGHVEQDYIDSDGIYSVKRLTAHDFKRKYEDGITLPGNSKLPLDDIISQMKGKTITIIGDAAESSVFTILV